MSEAWDKIQKLANEAADRLGLPHKKHMYNSIAHPDSSFDTDTAYSIMHLRNRVHDQDIEIMHLKQTIRDDELAREMNPAVQDAWDKYQTLLKLTKK